MSKSKNHWYLLRETVESSGSILGRAFRWMPLGLVTAIASILLLNMAPSWVEPVLPILSTLSAIPTLPLILLGVVFGWQAWRTIRLRAAYISGLQETDPSQLLKAVERMIAPMPATSGMGVIRAQARSLAFSLYGDEEGAVGALSQINWSAQAPVLQASGLFAEAFVEFLCRGNAARGLELSRRARELAPVSVLLAGPGGNTRVYDTLVAIGEVLSNDGVGASLDKLERNLSKTRFSPLKLLGRYAVAVGMTRVGKTERAEEARSFLRGVAPHCAPLHHLPTAHTALNALASETRAGPVSSALDARDPFTQQPEVKANRPKLFRGPVIVFGLILAFVFFYQWFNQSQP